MCMTPIYITLYATMFQVFASPFRMKANALRPIPIAEFDQRCTSSEKKFQRAGHHCHRRCCGLGGNGSLAVSLNKCCCWQPLL